MGKSGVKLPSARGSTTQSVWIEDPDAEPEPRSFHHKSMLHSVFGMIEVSENEARQMGAKPCSKCFRNVSCTDYNFSYSMDGGK